MPRALRQERRGLPPDVVVQGPRGRRWRSTRRASSASTRWPAPRPATSPTPWPPTPPRRRLKSYIFIPADLEQGKVIATLVYGPTLVAVQGTYDEVNRLCSEIADKYRWAFVNINLRPYYAEGSKTLRVRDRRAARLADARARRRAVRRRLADHQDLQGVPGAGDPRPHRRRAGTQMHAAQAAGCGPIVTMIKNDTDVLVPVRPNTIAKSLAIGNPADGYYAYTRRQGLGRLRRARHRRGDRRGDAAAGPHRGHLRRDRGRRDGGGDPEADRAGRIPRDEPIVICITGNGLKTPDVAARPAARARDDPALARRPSTARWPISSPRRRRRRRPQWPCSSAFPRRCAP